MREHNVSDASETRKDGQCLAALCLGFLMIGMSGTSVNLALSDIAIDLHLTEGALIWVVNAYLMTFGGLLLVGGRLGDVFGHSRMFLCGILIFTVAALGCAVSASAQLLLVARAVQGIGGAVASATALSAIADIFTDVKSRTRALSIRATVGASGSSVGLLFGGAVTTAYGWRGMFLVSSAIGACICVLAFLVLPSAGNRSRGERLNLAAATSVTVSLLLIVYVFLGSAEEGWFSEISMMLLAIAIVLLLMFLRIERSAQVPVLPASLIRARDFTIANVSAALWSGAVLAGNVLAALYLQRVLGLSPLEVGLTFLPASLVGSLAALWLSPMIAIRFGFKLPLVAGFAASALGLIALTFESVRATVPSDLVPGLLMIGLGTGLGYSPLLLAALNKVPSAVSGAASGVINSSLTMGGAITLTILMGVSTLENIDLVTVEVTSSVAHHGSYFLAWALAALSALGAAALGGLLAGERTSSADS